MAGAPIGNNNGANKGIARRALLSALKRKSGIATSEAPEEFEALIRIWEKQIDQATDGDNTSCNNIVDRLDGKPKQAVIGGEDEDSPINIIHRIELVALEGPTSDT